MSVIILSCFVGEDVPACGKRRTRDETLKGLTKSVHETLCLEFGQHAMSVLILACVYKSLLV